MFFRALLRFSAVRLRRALHFLAGFLAAGGGGGESSSYFENIPHRWNAQARAGRLASLGGHLVLHFRFKNELAFVGEKNFLGIHF